MRGPADLSRHHSAQDGPQRGCPELPNVYFPQSASRGVPILRLEGEGLLAKKLPNSSLSAQKTESMAQHRNVFDAIPLLSCKHHGNAPDSHVGPWGKQDGSRTSTRPRARSVSQSVHFSQSVLFLLNFCRTNELLWVSVGQYFIFGALCPSKSGLMNKHIVKQTYRETYRVF